MSQISEAIEIFKKRRKFYKSIDVRIAAINAEGSWYNVRTRVLLSCDKATGLIQRKIDVGNFMIIFENISADNFPNLLETIDRDEVEVDGVRINFFAGKPHQLSFEDWYRKSSERAKERLGIDWPLDMFRWRVGHKFQNELRHILEDVSLRLNCYDPPYEDVYKAVREFLGLHEWEFREYDTKESMCYILLPNYLAIKNCTLDGNQLDFEAKFHPSIAHGDLRLNIIAKGKISQKHQETFARKHMLKYRSFKLIKKQMVLKDTVEVQVYLFLKGKEGEGPSDKRYVRNLNATINPRLMAHESFDVDGDTLTKWLHGHGRNRSDDFEHALTILLHTCGFFTEWLGRKGLAKDAPDIVAFCPEQHALIVGECKTDVFGWKEIRKLKDRAEKLCQELKIDTYPAMFTSIDPNDIDKQTRTKAGNERIAILSNQEIDEILKMALRGSRSRDVLKRYFQYGFTYPLK